MKISSNKFAGFLAGAAALLAIVAMAGCSAGEPVIVETVRTVEVPAEPIVKEVVRTVEVPVVVEVEREVVKEVVVEVASTPVTRDVVRTVTVEVPVVVEKVERVEVPVVVEKVVEKVVVATPAPPPPAPTPTPAPATRTVTDDARQEAEIPFSPRRIAVTNAWMVELLTACGNVPVARPRIPLEFVYPPEAHDIPVVAVSHSAGPNIEQLAAARPDLILTSPTYGRFAGPIAQALRVPVLIYDINTVDDVLSKLETFGEIANCSEKANAAADALRAKIAAQREGLPEEGPRAFGIFGTSESFLAFTSSSYLGDMTVKLNGSMVTDGDPPYVYRGIPDPAYTPFSLEKVVERDPDVVMVVRHGDPDDAREANFASLFSGAAWSGLSAVENGRTSELSEWLYLRYPGPRAAWAMSELRPILYPDDEAR